MVTILPPPLTLVTVLRHPHHPVVVTRASELKMRRGARKAMSTLATGAIKSHNETSLRAITSIARMVVSGMQAGPMKKAVEALEHAGRGWG